MSSTAERYKIVDRIGAGGLGVVYKVEDRVSGEILAMKVMPRDRGTANLRSEFLALARLRHDNIVAVFDYGLTAAGHDFFTMEYVEGPRLLAAVSEIPSPTFYLLIGGVLRALAFVHSRGMVHADIKPSNVLIDAEVLAQDPTRAARLVDFGLSAAVDDPDASAARGTFPYAAPEVYAGRLDARSDLYAAGVVLYEMATGVKPYTGRHVREVLEAQRRGPPEDPRAHRPELPADLAELILALVDPVPGARPQTADEVLSRINDIAGTDFAIDSSQPLVDLSGVLVGRDRDLDELTRAWRDAGKGMGSAILLCGEEGIGKSRLIDEMKLRVQLAGGHAFAAEVASDQRTPYAGVSKLVRGLLASLSGTAADASEWSQALAPLLGNRTEAPRIDPESRFALAEAVAGVLQQLASAHPILVTIDDVHLADQATSDLLSYLIRAVPDAGVLLVLGARQTSFSAAPERTAPTEADSRVTQFRIAIRNAERGVRIDLPPLDGTSVYRLVENAFGADIATKIGDELYRTTGGNPAYVTRAMEALVAGGTIARERGAWMLRDEAPAIALPPDAREVALERIARLPEAARWLLRAASVLGQHFPRRLLVEVVSGEPYVRDPDGDAGASAPPGAGAEAFVDAALTEAVRERLIHAEATIGEFRFPHAGVVEVLHDGLTPDERARLHRRAAEVLEADVARGVKVAASALAAHYFATGDRERALTWGLRAAEEHARSYDHHGSLGWYEKLRALVTDDQAAQIDERLGDLYALLGRVGDALASYDRAYDQYAASPADHIRLARRLGELHRRRGQGEVALEILMAALQESHKHDLPDQEAQCHLQIGWVLVNRANYKQAMEHAVAGHLIARSNNDLVTSVELGRLRASIVIYQGETKAAMSYLDAALREAESTGNEVLVAHVLRQIGRAAFHIGDHTRTIDALEKAIPAIERVGHIEETAKALNNLAAACYFQGDWERARVSWERFRRLCDRVDDQMELVNALNNLGSLYRDMGQFNEALAALDRAQTVAEQTGRVHVAAMIQGNRGETLFRLGDLANARECYERALREFEQIGARDDIIENRRRLCEVDIATGRLNEALDRAIDTAREAKDAHAKLEEGILHRVAATALRLQGDLESAAWFTERAREIVTRLGAKYERAKVDVAAAELAAVRGQTAEAERHLNAAIERFAALGARWDLKMARSRKRALLPGQSGFSLTGSTEGATATGPSLELLLGMTQALANVEIERLLEIALDKVLELTNFERGFILLLDDEGRPRERLRRVRPGAKGFERTEAEFSGTIVRRVAAGGEAAMVNDISQEQDLRDQKSVVSLGLRQIMCAPMRSHGRVIGVLYVDSRRLTFEEHTIDLVLLEAVAAQIALAVENARLVSQDKQQTELMAVLAHEIRNPLAGIIGYADMGESGDPAEIGLDIKGVLRRIRGDAERLRRLVDNVLELTRHESGNVDWSMKPFDIIELIHNVVDSNQPVCDQKKIRIRAAAGEVRAPAVGNADRIMQVLANLVSNAIKFTPPNGEITLSARSEIVAASDPDAPPMPASDIGAWLPMELGDDVTREFVRVEVTDTGPGMSEELRDRLFEKFAQGSGKRRSSGIGLGLYISREIILRHGGTIWVQSELGKGATFSFRIPVSKSE